MAITKQEVIHLAKLARIELSREEVDKFQDQLSSVLDYVDKLKKVDAKKVNATFGAAKEENVSRPDKAESFPKQENLLKQAPEQQDNFYKVKEVLK